MSGTSIEKILMKFNVILSHITLTGILVWPFPTLGQADSVSGGRSFTGKSKAVIVTKGNGYGIESPGLTYLMKGILLQSTTTPYSQATVRFGPFLNESPYAITITFSHVGGGSRHHVNAYVDGTNVGHTDGDILTFQIPRGSSYGWELKNEHTITASVPAEIRFPPDTGLPTAAAFQSPRRMGKYLGCVFDGASALNYLYSISPMTDGSDAWGGPVPNLYFGDVVVGPPPVPTPATEECVLTSPQNDFTQ